MTNSRTFILLLLTLVLLLAAATYGVANSQSGNGKYDTDGDGLIEIQYLEQLDAIRYDLDGDGRSDDERYAAAFPTTGAELVCESDCNGYELVHSLDFAYAGSYISGTVNTPWTTGTGWLPIGFGDNLFNATLEGNGYTISSLYINRTTVVDDPGVTGLFGMTSTFSIIKEIGLTDVNITGGQIVGGLTAWNLGMVNNSHSTGSIVGSGSLGQDGKGGVGGLIGINSGTIKTSHTSGIVSGESGVGGLVGNNAHQGHSYGLAANPGVIIDSYSSSDVSGRESSIGGLAGGNFGEIMGSHATGTVSSQSDGRGYLVGGLVGWNEGEIENSYSSGSVSGSSEVGGLAGRNVNSVTESFSISNVSGEDRIGGLVGENSGSINSSYASGAITGEQSAIGGLVGWNRGNVKSSYATGNVSGNGNPLGRGEYNTGVGGLLGSNSSVVYASYATGNVLGIENVGGLVGYNGAAGRSIAGYAAGSVTGEKYVGGLVGSNAGTISASYTIGVVSGKELTGGLIGENSGSVIAGYWDTQTSGHATSAAGEGKTTAEIQSPTGYTGVYAAWRIDLDNADQDFDQSTGIDDFWDFGTSNQYPAVKADFDGDGVATWQEFGNQRPQSPAPTSTTGAIDSNARPSGAVFEELVNAGLLVVVWRYDNATQSWDAYDPSVPAEINDLTHAAPKDIVWVEVAEETQFQGRTLRKGWNLISLK